MMETEAAQELTERRFANYADTKESCPKLDRLDTLSYTHATKARVFLIACGPRIIASEP